MWSPNHWSFYRDVDAAALTAAWVQLLESVSIDRIDLQVRCASFLRSWRFVMMARRKVVLRVVVEVVLVLVVMVVVGGGGGSGGVAKKIGLTSLGAYLRGRFITLLAAGQAR